MQIVSFKDNENAFTPTHPQSFPKNEIIFLNI